MWISQICFSRLSYTFVEVLGIYLHLQYELEPKSWNWCLIIQVQYRYDTDTKRVTSFCAGELWCSILLVWQLTGCKYINYHMIHLLWFLILRIFWLIKVSAALLCALFALWILHAMTIDEYSFFYAVSGVHDKLLTQWNLRCNMAIMISCSHRY